MSKIIVIGAGKTGRGFIGRLICESRSGCRNTASAKNISDCRNTTSAMNVPGCPEIIFIDKNKELVTQLNQEKSFTVSFFGGRREDFTVDNFCAYTWEKLPSDLFAQADLILVSVCGPNLKDVGKELSTRLHPDKHYYIITCENSSHPSVVLKEAIGLSNVSVSEATVFCTTIEKTGLDISSENYPYLQCDGDLLDGYVPPVKAIKPISAFGNFLTRKLFTYNAASCIIAYLGWLKGYTDYAEAANDEEILQLLDRNYAVTNDCLCREFGYEKADQEEFAKLSRDKFTDRTIADTVARNAREPQRKLGKEERIIGPLLVINHYGQDASVLEMTAAAALLYDNEGEDTWRAIKSGKTCEELLTGLCGLTPDCPSFAAITAYYHKFSYRKKGEPLCD